MKREATSHPKLAALERRLGVMRCTAVGILELLWHFTARYTPAGNVGKYADAAIAAAVGWEKSPGELIDALVDCGWLDRHDEHRLAVHDWADHADDTVHRRLARMRITFADGSAPKLTRLPRKERIDAEKFYRQQRNLGGAHGVRTRSVHDRTQESRPLADTDFTPPTDGVFHRRDDAELPENSEETGACAPRAHHVRTACALPEPEPEPEKYKSLCLPSERVIDSTKRAREGGDSGPHAGLRETWTTPPDAASVEDWIAGHPLLAARVLDPVLAAQSLRDCWPAATEGALLTALGAADAAARCDRVAAERFRRSPLGWLRAWLTNCARSQRGPNGSSRSSLAIDRTEAAFQAVARERGWLQ